MQKVTRKYEIDRYEIRARALDVECEEDMGVYEGVLKVYFNTANTGLCEIHNFAGFEEAEFENVAQIEAAAEKLDLKNWAVFSFYRENGYTGIYSRSDELALKVKCNNWVNQGRDGFVFIAFAKDKEEIAEFEKRLFTFIYEGFALYEIYDNLEEDAIEWAGYTGDKASTSYLEGEFMKKARELGIETNLYDVKVVY